MDRRYVGIDLHCRRSVIYAMDAQGDRLFCERITNDALRLLEVVSEAGEGAEVVIEATYGWYWAVDLLQDAGFSVHLAHPSGNDWGNRRVKNDERDARDLADLLRLGRLAEAWIAPPAVREARELVRYRARLVQLRSGLKAQVHAVMAKEGVLPGVTDMFGPKGQQLLDAMELADAYVVRVESLRDLIDGQRAGDAWREGCDGVRPAQVVGWSPDARGPEGARGDACCSPGSPRLDGGAWRRAVFAMRDGGVLDYRNFRYRVWLPATSRGWC